MKTFEWRFSSGWLMRKKQADAFRRVYRECRSAYGFKNQEIANRSSIGEKELENALNPARRLRVEVAAKIARAVSEQREKLGGASTGPQPHDRLWDTLPEAARRRAAAIAFVPNDSIDIVCQHLADAVIIKGFCREIDRSEIEKLFQRRVMVLAGWQSAPVRRMTKFGGKIRDRGDTRDEWIDSHPFVGWFARTITRLQHAGATIGGRSPATPQEWIEVVVSATAPQGPKADRNKLTREMMPSLLE